MFCVHCGARMPENTKYCPMCGSAIEADAQQETVTPTDWSLYARPENEPTAQQPREFVWPEFMQTPVEEEFRQTPEKVKRPVNKKKLWLSIGAAVLALCVIAAVLLQTVKKTVYLPVSNVQIQSYTETGWMFAYDPQGRLTKLEYVYGVSEQVLGVQRDTKIGIYYFYQPNGNLKRAEIYLSDTGDYMMQMVVEYRFKGDVLQDFTIEAEAEKAPLEVKCDRKGRIEFVGILDEDGEKEAGWEFSYYGQGGLSKSIFWNGFTRQERRYDREGHMIQQELYQDDQLQYKLAQAYDDHGNVVEKTTFVEHGSVALETVTEIAYTYEKNRIVDLQVHNENTSNGERAWLKMDFACRWGGNKCEITVEDVEGDGSFYGITETNWEDFCILLKKDKWGNTTFYEVLQGEEQVMRQEYAYESYRLPWYYKQVDGTVDPRYMYFIFDGLNG